jgi:glycosyltransferase involved in cell wall biosynthesis
MFKWEPRKNPELLLRAYWQEFSAADDVLLHLHTYIYLGGGDTHNPAAVKRRVDELAARLGLPDEPLRARVSISAHVLPAHEVPRLYRAADAFVLATRGEGWGLPAIQAMAMGLPTIATNWSGLSEFLSAETAFPVRVERMVQAESREYEPGQLWAEADVTHLRHQMRYVFANREEARRIGQRARLDVTRRFSRAAVADIIERRWREIASVLPATNPPVSSPTDIEAAKRRGAARSAEYERRRSLLP